MIRRVLRVLVIELLSSLSLSCGASGQVPPPLPAPPLGGLPPERRLPLAEERLTRADIPSGLSHDFREELEGTFDADAKVRAKRAEAIGKRGARACPRFLS